MSDTEDKESLARANLPYRAEYCKTSRAKCKKCSENMEAGSLKLAVMTKSRFHDGYDAAYSHVNCFFKMKRPTSVAEIRHFETLKYEDQKMLEKAIETNGKSVLGVTVEEPSKGKSKDKKSKKAPAVKRSADEESVLVNYEDFLVEYAKSSRATCKKCEEKIEKSTIRLGKLDYDAETPYNAGPVPRWYHLKCFIEAREKLEFFGEIKKVKGFKDLEEEDQKMLRKTIKPMKPDSVESCATDEKRLKKEDEATSSRRAEEESALKKQSDRFFKLREFVDSMKRKDIEQMLDYMDQKSDFKASTLLVDMATDVLLYGPLENCPKCHSSKGMILRGSSYICTRNINEVPCTYETREPKRGVPDVPEEVVEKYYDFFDNYKFRGGARIFPSAFVKAVEQKEAEDNHTALGDAPLEGVSIGLISWNSIETDKTKVQKKILTLGAKLQTSLDSSIFVIITNEAELSKNHPKVEVAKALNVPFAKEDFLFKIQKREDVLPELKKCLIAEWDGDLDERLQKKTSIKKE